MKKFLSLTGPEKQDAAQVLGYKKDALQRFPQFDIKTCLIYVAGNKGFRFFSLGD